MKRFIALLRAVNVGGTGKLPMPELVKICEAAGFENVRTYIASGNVVFSSRVSENEAKKLLEERLAKYAGKPVAVFIRDANEMKRILDANPFADKAPNQTVAIFLETKPAKNVLENAAHHGDEEVQNGKREIYIHYPAGMGKSKLKLPAAEIGTARNMNTIAKLVEMAAKD